MLNFLHFQQNMLKTTFRLPQKRILFNDICNNSKLQFTLILLNFNFLERLNGAGKNLCLHFSIFRRKC
jgi:hypothetical protein